MASAGKAFMIAVSLIAAELFLAILSFPVYLAARSIEGNTQETEEYHVRRVMTLSVVSVILTLWILKLITILVITFYFNPQSSWYIQETPQREMSDTRETAIIEVTRAKENAAMPTPEINHVERTRAATIISGRSEPNAWVVLTAARKEETSNETPRMFSTQSDASGNFVIAENTSVFSLPPGDYIADAVAYDAVRNEKSAESKSIAFRVETPIWRIVSHRIDTILNISLLLLVLLGVGVTLLTLSPSQKKKSRP